jgi:enamine deaminase RidA (YjgF/YER057c/UK114 family)
MTRTTHNPPHLFQSTKYGFSQLASATAGQSFVTAGQVSVDARENIIGNTLHAQMTQSMNNLNALLTSAGGSLSDVLSLRIYIVQSQEGHLQAVGEVLRDFFGTEDPPCSSWIGVAFLARKEYLVEIEATGTLAT